MGRWELKTNRCMSLKAFHIVFVVSSVLLMFGMGAWSYGQYQSSGSVLDLVWTGAAVAAGLGLSAYGRYFLRKLEHISFL